MRGLVGKHLDHYRIESEVGQGGMAVVYRAVDTNTNQEVALKVLSPTIAGDRRFIRRFRREGGLLARMKHPNIVPVLDYGESGGYVYLAMPFVRGSTLAVVLKTNRLKLSDVTRWIGQICDALQYAHSRGIIHRDVKPSNIIINDEGNALLTDFGLARQVEGTNTLTGSMLLGTPAYMSPEQAQGDPVEEASDQYSLGVVLYQVFAGRLPFDGDAPMATVMMHIKEPVPRPGRFNPSIPDPVERVILKSLAKKPAYRYTSVAALKEALEASLRGDSTSRATQLMPGSAVRKSAEQAGLRGARQQNTGRPRRFLLLVLAPLALSVLVGAAWLVWQFGFSGEDEPAADLSVYDAQNEPSAEPVQAEETPASLPTAVTSDSCPGLRMINFQREGAALSWSLDNSMDQSVQLLNASFLIPQDNWIVSMALGSEVLLELDPFSPPDPDAALEIPADDRTIIPAGNTIRLELRYAVSEVSPGGVEFMFDDGCTLQTDW